MRTKLWGVIDIDPDKIDAIAVIGSNVDETLVLVGNHMGTPAEPVSVLSGTRAIVSPETEINYVQGCELIGISQAGFAEVIEAAKKLQW